MRRSYYFLLAILMLALVSCEKDVIMPEQSKEFALEQGSLSESEKVMLDKMEEASKMIVNN